MAQSDPSTFDEYLDAVETLIFERMLGSPRRLRIMFELLPKIMFDPAFVANRKIGLDNAVGLMSEKLRDAVGDDAAETELTDALKSISVFVSGLATYSVTTRGEDSRLLWRQFRELLSDRLTRSGTDDAR